MTILVRLTSSFSGLKQSFWTISGKLVCITNKYAYPELNLIMNCAGTSSADAGGTLMEKNKEKKERRHSAPLPVSAAATIQVARSASNALISNVLQQLANPQREASEMDTSGNGTAEPKVIASGSGTAGPSAGGSGTAGSTNPIGSGTAGSSVEDAGTAGAAQLSAGKAAPYRNFHGDDEAVAGSGNGIVFTSARLGMTFDKPGPVIVTADCFECGSIFVEGDNRTSRSVLVEDTKELVVSTSSFIKEDWSCISCRRSHPLLPLVSQKQEWMVPSILFLLSSPSTISR
jgi:hypothetical protein